MRISDWSSDVCSSDLQARIAATPSSPEATAIQYQAKVAKMKEPPMKIAATIGMKLGPGTRRHWIGSASMAVVTMVSRLPSFAEARKKRPSSTWRTRSEEHTSELQSLMRISYAVFCLKKKNTTNMRQETTQ